MQGRIGSPAEIMLVFAMFAMRFVPFVLIGGAAWWLLGRSEFGRSLTRRLQESGNDGESIAALASEMDQVKLQLAEVQERLDFAERLLARGESSRALPAPVGEDTPTPPEPVAAGR